jgi:pimeloyl-ACP methyl ester carboxylesterase
MSLLKSVPFIDRWFPTVARAKQRRGVWPSREAMFENYRGRGAFRTWPEDVVRDYISGGAVDYIDYRQVRLACTPGWEAANYRAGPPDLWRELGNLKVPITLIVGEKRSTCPRIVIDLLLKKCPDMRVISVPEAGHFLPMENPGIVRREIRLMAGIAG